MGVGCVSCGVHTRLCAHAPFLIHVEARVRYRVLSSIIFHVTALRHGLSLSKKLSLWMSLADLVSSGSLPISTLGPQCWGYRSMELFWLFMWVLGIGTQVLTLAEEASYPLTYLSKQAPWSACRLTKPYTKHLTSHSPLCSSWEAQFHLLALPRHLI